MLSSPAIAILAHPRVNNALGEAGRIADFLQARACQASHSSLYDDSLRQAIGRGEYGLVIALGGDGTLLRAGHLCAPLGIPILGINMGRFGFLTEINSHEWEQRLPQVLSGDYWLERRMMLTAEHWMGGELRGAWDVLNEVVVGRGQTVRPVHLVTHVDGRYLTTYVADGLIAATPTGSTAYALAAGGPILPPELRNILLVAVAPHLSLDRAIVLAEGSEVSISAQADHPAVLCVDGQTPVTLEDGALVKARASHHTVQFLRFQDPGYFYRNLTPHMSENPAAGNTR
jgi:NAD+ kinase